MIHKLTDGPPFERSVGNVAGMAVAAAQYPRFTDRAVRQRRREYVVQVSPAPQPILIDRLESQRIHADPSAS